MDRLALLSCFGRGKNRLKALLEQKDKRMHLSASVILCEIDDEAPTYLRELCKNEKPDTQVPGTVIIKYDAIVSALFKLGAVEGLFDLLASRHDPVVVAGLGILVALALNVKAQQTMQRLGVWRELLKLMKRDDRVRKRESTKTSVVRRESMAQDTILGKCSGRMARAF
ncbi:hypothetical protein SERLADRAFT_457432 [Serpula lacrymans var. lacrymans S7.9]|nr:uncharacterized protein SERLADRAFT_457432 [Serpula lacrymans var. lacrymans S7.9]EGO29545.1 hypothetical protein SERLADRAFT_457432 [Serpula lacrymans var. lacrymans S7.9]